MTDLGSVEFWDRLSAEPARLSAEVCLINIVDLDTTLQRHASQFAWVSAAHETARIQEERAKWEVTKARARAMVEAAKNAEPPPEYEGKKKGKAKTVGVLDAEVELDAEVQERTRELFTAQEKRGALRAMADSLTQRKDMLIQISAKRRQEQGNY